MHHHRHVLFEPEPPTPIYGRPAIEAPAMTPSVVNEHLPVLSALMFDPPAVAEPSEEEAREGAENLAAGLESLAKFCRAHPNLAARVDLSEVRMWLTRPWRGRLFPDEVIALAVRDMAATEVDPDPEDLLGPNRRVELPGGAIRLIVNWSDMLGGGW